MAIPLDRRRWRPELILLVTLAAITRFWHLSWPRAVVFDEALYEEYVSHYFNGTYYFNLHPPVGKLLLALGAKVIGIAPATLAAPDPAVTLRVLPALAGTLIIPVFWLLLRQLGASRRVAALGAFLLMMDTALLTVSRFILIDSMLILFMLGSVCAYLAARERTGAVCLAFAAGGGVLAGLAAGTKWTGLGALAVILLLWLQRAAGRRAARRQLTAEALMLTVVPAVVYVGAFAVHFALLPHTGNGDQVMSAAFRETLGGSPIYRHDAHMSLAAKVVDMHRAMLRENAALDTAAHPGASPWWSWPILKHPLYIWNDKPDAAGRTGHVFIEGNPVLWWAILIALGALAVSGTDARRRLAEHRGALLLMLAAYLINYLPFAFIGRILFLYSYLPALIFSLALVVMGVGTLAGWMTDAGGPLRFPSRRSAALYWGCAGLTLAAFVYFAPFSYGTPMTDAAYQRRLWVLERHVGKGG